MKLVIIRHCETDWNVEHRWQGHTDTDLNENGRKQAERIADELMPLKIDLIFSSPLRRARQTGEIIAGKLKTPLNIDTRLKECAFGKLEGLTVEQAFDLHQFKLEPVASQVGAEQDFDQFGGETARSVRTRHLDFLNFVKRNYGDKTVLAIGHGRGFNVLLAALNQTPNLQREEYRILETNKLFTEGTIE